MRHRGTPTIELRVHPRSAVIARRFAREVTSGYPADPDTVALVTSELVTNGLRAAARLAADTGHPWRDCDQPVHLHVRPTSRWTLIGVRDPHPDAPRYTEAGVLEESGRGLEILKAVSEQAWTIHAAFHKTVWVLLAAPGVMLTPADIEAARPQGTAL
jgi:hypothetical protein